MSDTTLRDLVYGKGAHVDPVACVEDVSSELATQTVAAYPHSIWQIVEHMNYWMDYELKKIAGEDPAYPDHAIESWPLIPRPPQKNSGRRWWAASANFWLNSPRLPGLTRQRSSASSPSGSRSPPRRAAEAGEIERSDSPDAAIAPGPNWIEAK